MNVVQTLYDVVYAVDVFSVVLFFFGGLFLFLWSHIEFYASQIPIVYSSFDMHSKVLLEEYLEA